MTTENKNDDTTTIARRAGILPPDHCDLLKYMIKLHWKLKNKWKISRSFYANFRLKRRTDISESAVVVNSGRTCTDIQNLLF